MARLLLDEQIPRRMAGQFPDHVVRSVRGMGWASLSDGALLSAAESDFDVLLTADKGFRFQQSVLGRGIAVVIIRSYRTRFADLLPHVGLIAEAIDNAQPGTVTEVDLKPFQ